MDLKAKVPIVKDVGTKKIIILIGLIFILSGVLGVNYYIDSRDISGLSNVYSQPTVIYDGNGEVASKITGSKIKGVQIEQIPEHLISAVVAIEDRRFYKHPGVDYIGIGRALFTNLKAGEIVEGGSTITQQLTKNVFLTHDQTLARKIEEFFLAQKIERTYSKGEIIEMYLNQIYFGEGAWGIYNAADHYFGKAVEDLTLGESATLAGLVKAPSRLSPIKDYEKSIERRNLVLSAMKLNEFITETEYTEAIATDIVLQEKQIDPYEGKFPYYVDHIIEEAIKFGITENEILAGGLHIFTELDQHMQASVEEVFSNDSLFPEGTEDQLVQSGTVLLNSKTGGIHALVGGRGEHVFRGFNRATQLTRQPGSTMKPLAVYTPALENGYSMNSVLPDKPVDFNGYQPKNYNGAYKGSVTVYDALKSSDNVPAVWLLNELGVKTGIESVNKFGIPLTDNDQYLPLALGGMDKGVAPIHMAEAYAAFPNGGVRNEAHAITKITDSEGNTLMEWKEDTTQVTTPEVAASMTYMLKGVIDEGTGRNAKIPGLDLAGKTGSTQVPIDGINGTKDQWFVGFTPEIVGALWVGYDHTDKDHYLTTTSSQTSAIIFKALIEKALSNVQSTSFDFSNSFIPAQSQKVENSNTVQQHSVQKKEEKNNNQKEKDNWKNKEKGKGNDKGKGNGKGNKKKDD